MCSTQVGHWLRGDILGTAPIKIGEKGKIRVGDAQQRHGQIGVGRVFERTAQRGSAGDDGATIF